MSRIKKKEIKDNWVQYKYMWLFRRECIKCHYLIKNEYMYRTGVYKKYDYGTDYIYYCTTCFHSTEEVLSFNNGVYK